MKTEPKLEPWMSAFERFTGAKFVTAKAIGQDEIDEEIVKEEEDIKNMKEKETLQEILYILADVVEEQATRELSGTDWGSKNVKKINELIKKL